MSQLPEHVRAELQPLARNYSLWMFMLDPPDHTRIRGLTIKAFTPRVVESMRFHVQQIVDKQLDAVQRTGTMEVIQDLAYPLPAIVIAEMLGVPPEERDQFKYWSTHIASFIARGYSVPDKAFKAQEALLALSDYLKKTIAARRQDPKNDLISALISAEEKGDMCTEEEIISTCSALLLAGHETTTNLIGNGLLALIHHPDQLIKLRNNPSLITSAVEELVRYDTPLQATARMATQDFEMCGKQIKSGQRIMAILGAANRDPEQFPDPDRLDIERSGNRHLGFGIGIHFCLGAALARLEAEIAINTVLQRLPNIRLCGSLQWLDTMMFRGVKALPVTFDRS
jgi:cytochrome P450